MSQHLTAFPWRSFLWLLPRKPGAAIPASAFIAPVHSMPGQKHNRCWHHLSIPYIQTCTALSQCMHLMERATNKKLTKSDNEFPVVGIGASAGGLEAFKKLLHSIPEDSGMAYVLVQHLDPNHESILTELLQKVTTLPVLEITDDIKVQPNHVYIIPSNKMLLANDGVLELKPRPPSEKNKPNHPINLFFASLAEVHQSHAIGVVLSGTANDGTDGLRAIKEYGGLTFAQEESSAAYPGMPSSAIEAGVVDFILPVEAITQKILEINKTIRGIGNEDGEPLPQDEDTIRQIISLLRIRKGTDFTYYKQATIRRRILRRMVIQKNENLSGYLSYLRDQKTEQDVLYQDLLIPVTDFFRDTKTFDNLCENIFPLIVKNKIPGDTIRVWVAGCSTGQEAYSIAICLNEFLGENQHQVQVFASDISEPAIAKARTGVYTKTEVEGLSTQRLNEFFTKTTGGYQVNKVIRDQFVFALHNFTKDPPFGKMDLISCRNVIIYMEPYLQKKALTTFHYALNQKGFLLLGKSETTSGVGDLFASVIKNDKLFSRKDVPGRFMHVTSQRAEQNLTQNSEGISRENIRTDFQKTADDIILSNYSPAGVIVNEAFDIVHFKGSTNNYLEQLPGKPSHNVLKMARHGLSFELRNILHKARRENKPVKKENVAVQINDQLNEIDIEAIPLPTIEPYYLLLFHNHPVAKTSSKKAVTSKTKSDDDDLKLRIQQLEKELAQAREDMRSITEEQEVVNEELQSANEELLSGSEELQSLNEELETSKEELQSTNEELSLLNQELNNLNDQLILTKDYSESIVSTVLEPLLVLDESLMVQSANASFYKTFKAQAKETEGKLIYKLGEHEWDIPGLKTLLERIIPEQSSFDGFEVSHTFISIGHKTFLLNGRQLIREKGGKKLILLAIGDITQKRIVEQNLEKSEAGFKLMAETIPQLIWITNADGKIDYCNPQWYNYTGTLADTNTDNKWARFIHPEDKGNALDQWEESINTGKPASLEYRIKNAEANYNWFLVKAVPWLDKKGKIIKWFVSATNIETQKKAAELLRKSADHFRQLVQKLNVAVYSCDAKGLVNFYNDAAEKLWGRQPVIGEDYLCGSWKLYKADGLPMEMESCPMAIALKEGRSTTPEEVIIERPDGSRSIVLVHPQPEFGVDGEITGAVNMMLDITEVKKAELILRQSEAYFRQMAELMPQKIWTADSLGNRNYFNQKMLDYTGKTLEELANDGWKEQIHPEDLEETSNRWNFSVQTGKDFEVENRLLHQDGSYLWHLSRANNILEDGKIKMWIGSNTDINNIKEEETRKGEFIKMVSHELKTPVTSIKGYVQLLLMIVQDDETCDYPPQVKSSLIRIDKQVLRLTRLITEMLDLSRIEAGKLALNTEKINICDLVKETTEDIRHTNTKHTIEVHADFDCYVFGDKSRLEQVLINLLNNAIKYSKENNNIVVRIEKGDNDTVAVSVKDLGIGIDKKEHDKIFNRFYRVEGEVEQTFAGFGIGLFLANNIIERHNGTIGIDSEKGKGSKFTFFLPVISG